ncbi:CYTH domain-containing protein [Paenibacillus crassostreae]|uniref:Adenylate cyclase n=1 Tax=Paenibacillus crassostreae TaxID=1763538 RepID=A0A167GSB9_9BACL|nr:CYTH domain-containing protein [Paenibacillus crassostreae]AOZ92047.1 adenylate cyclase [Paenibacillus crassostreae]OAB77856.1 adenylate cyclase [Paenibacillus crassostreae]
MSLEIERKFLLSEFPDTLVQVGTLRIISEQRIEQTYLALDATQELRVRRIVDLTTGETTYTHTFKNGNGLVREEIEYSISEEIYTQIVNAFGAVPLTKNRITAAWEDTLIEIDCYDQIEMIVVEVEFESVEVAESFEVPVWFGEDISSQKQYSNKQVWKELQKQRNDSKTIS